MQVSFVTARTGASIVMPLARRTYVTQLEHLATNETLQLRRLYHGLVPIHGLNRGNLDHLAFVIESSGYLDSTRGELCRRLLVA